MTEPSLESLPDRMREHGSFRRDSKDMLNMGAAEIERLRARVAQLQADFDDEISQTHGMARWGCQQCIGDSDQDVLGSLTSRCVRCGTGSYAATVETTTA